MKEMFVNLTCIKTKHLSVPNTSAGPKEVQLRQDSLYYANTVKPVMWPSKGTVKYGHIRQVVAKYRFNWCEMHYEKKN